jgi:peptidyl-prolyl cis-trans isomerase D
MLQSLRDGLGRRKWLAWVALAPIALIFIFWGGSSSLDFSGASSRDAAKVNGDKIPASEASKLWSQEQARWSREQDSEMPAEQRSRIQEEILDSLVMNKLLEQRLAKENYRMSESRVLSEFEKIPAFQDENGKFNSGIARQRLYASGVSENEFFRQMRIELLQNQLQRGIADTNFLTPGESERFLKLQNEEREVEYARFDAAKFTGSEPIDEAAIKAYYDQNGDRFMTTESVSLEYAELRVEQLATQVTPTDDELRQLYEENRAALVVEERRRARHILIPVEENDDEAALKKADEAARKQAESVMAEARAGKDFAELAKKYSKDVTAVNGGEMDPAQRQDIPGPFGDALFAMKVGDISGPVKSQFGYHLIKLEEIQAGSQKPFEEVRAELDSEFRATRAAQIFGDRQEQISEMLEDGETDLDKLAQSAGLSRGSIAQFLRGGGAEPLGSSADLQQAVFDDTTLNQGKIGGPVALGDDRLVLVKVTSHHKAEVKPLAQVSEEIIQLLTHDRGVAAAKAAAEALVPRLEGGEKLATLAPAANASAEAARFIGRGDPSIPAALNSAVFEAPRPEGKPVVRSVSLDDGSTAVFVVTNTRVADTSANPMLKQQLGMMMARRSGVGDIAAYLGEAKRKAKIVKNPAVFEQ